MRITRRALLRLATHAGALSLLYPLRALFQGPSDHGASAAIEPPPPLQGQGISFEQYRPLDHDWAFLVDTGKCIGCGRCLRACKAENNVPWDGAYNRTWVERYRFTEDGEVVVDSPEGGINGFVDIDEDDILSDEPQLSFLDALPDQALPHDEVMPDEESVVKAFFVPKLCNQCDEPPCVQVCPVAATYKTPDGIVLVDQSRCIGCRYCIQACPYGARYLLPDARTTPMGQIHVVDKCTWCYHRITRGLMPACVEACPVGARQFGDLRDPESTVARAVAEQRLHVLKADLGTRPQVFYIELDEAVR